MSLRTVLGLVLIVMGVAAAAWGITEMRTLTWRFWREVGRPHYTAPIVTAAGGLLTVIGIGLAVTKK